MTLSSLNHFDILEAKKAFAEGRNVTELLRNQKRLEANTSEIIETAYDLQAGTYIQHVEQNKAHASLYVSESAGILESYIINASSLLDIGTGEMTTLSLLTQHLKTKPRNLLAFDISWSRIYKGLAYANINMGEYYRQLTAFVADISEMPLQDKSIDVTISSHALEPNGGRLTALMTELFRVTRDKLLLFEPCYEINSAEGKKRMDSLGYIKGIDSVVENLGGAVSEKIPIHNLNNPLNPTVCFVINPPRAAAPLPDPKDLVAESFFSVPGTNYPVKRMDDFYFSNITGLCYPILKSIPILKSRAAILASALSTDGPYR